MHKAFDEVTKEQLIADFKTVVADAEALLKATANHGGEEVGRGAHQGGRIHHGNESQNGG